MSLVYLEKYKTNAKIVSNMLEILENDILSLNAQEQFIFHYIKFLKITINLMKHSLILIGQIRFIKINPIFDVKNLQKDYSIKKVYNHSKISEFGKKGI